MYVIILYHHILSILDNTISNVTRMKYTKKYRDVRNIMLYIIAIYIVVFIAGICVGIYGMVKLQEILNKNNMENLRNKATEVKIML